MAINQNSVVSDETEHLYYGLRVLNGHPQKIYADDASTQPISALNALPRASEQLFNPGLKKTDGGVSDAIHGRYITLLICILIGLYVYRWSKEAFGENAGLFSLFLFTFCPNLQANIPLVGTDAYAVLFTLTSAYYFRRFILYSGRRNFILFSLQIGFAFIVKQSLFLLPLFYSVIALIVLIQRGSFKNKLKLNLQRLFALILIMLFIINAAFLFNGTGKPLEQYQFKSETFQRIQQQKIIRSIPLPLPVPFIEGYDGVKYMISKGSGHAEVSGKSYLMGQYFTGNKLWYYYSVVIFFKTPLIVLLLVIAVLIAYFKKPFLQANFFNIGFPLSLAFFFLIFISVNNTSQHGLRHLLMIFPLFYVCMGQVVNWRIMKPGITLVMMIYSVTTFYFYFPNLLSYTNELIWNKTQTYKILASTNIDHGQGAIALKKYLTKHPDTKRPGTVPETGEFIVSINSYLDLKDKKEHEWISNFEPYDHVNHCYLLFRITEKDLMEKKLK